MSTDTRPSVTVIGQLIWDIVGWYVTLDDLPDIGLQDGAEVEVTIRKHERMEEWPRRGWGGATEEKISELGIEPDGY